MAVKGSVHHPMRLVPYRPKQRILRSGLWLMAVIFGFSASYYAGVFSVQFEQRSAESAKAVEHKDLIDKLNQDITKLNTNVEVDRQTIEEMRKVVVTQKAQLAAADRDLHVYKDLLSPGTKTNPLGISVGTFTVSPLPEKGHFNYKILVQKLSTKEGDFSGALDVKITGQQSGKTLQLSLYQISPQMTTPTIPLSFKYFQNIDGDLQLPPDFAPQSVEVAVSPGDKKAPPIVITQLEWLESSL